MKKISYLWGQLKSSFWFVPVLMIAISMMLAFYLLYLDGQVTLSQKLLKYVFISNADSARSILSTISGAMIGVAGTVFSIILVVLTLTSSQFGSRLIKNFMYDRINQIVLGAYISIFLYCLIILNAIKDNDSTFFIPSISIMFAILFSISNIILLIIFIHHIAVKIQADNVVSNISESLFRNLKTIFPQTKENRKKISKEQSEEFLKTRYKKRQTLFSSENGYIQYIDVDSLLKIAKELNILIELYARPGNHLVKDLKIGTIYTNKKLNQEEIYKLESKIQLGKNRSPQQDAEHSIHQMVEIAIRALSPGINDSYTAIACIDNLTSVMCYLTQIEFPSKYRYDKEGKLRLIAEAFNYEDMLDISFNQIRQSSNGMPTILIRLMESLITINKFVKENKHKAALKKHAKMILNLAKKTIDEPNDLRDLKKKAKFLS